jgi:hypothetical protein
MRPRAQQHHAVQYRICPDASPDAVQYRKVPDPSLGVGGPDRVQCGRIGSPDDAVRYRICPDRRNHASGHGRTNAPPHHAPGPGTFQYPRDVITHACCGGVRGSVGSIMRAAARAT